MALLEEVYHYGSWLWGFLCLGYCCQLTSCCLQDIRLSATPVPCLPVRHNAPCLDTELNLWKCKPHQWNVLRVAMVTEPLHSNKNINYDICFIRRLWELKPGFQLKTHTIIVLELLWLVAHSVSCRRATLGLHDESKSYDWRGVTLEGSFPSLSLRDCCLR